MEVMCNKGACALIIFLVLAACGNEPAAQETRMRLPKGQSLGAVVAGLFVKSKSAPLDPSAVAALRVALEQAGQPVILVKVPSLGYANLFAPYGENRDVVTWASATYQSVALKGGVLVATRGFGPDLMSASVPTLEQVRRGSGTVHRDYYELDGADQSQRHSYDCTFAPGGLASVEVLGKDYGTRKVVETCVGPDLTFENGYWFNTDGTLRRSEQRAGGSLQGLQIDLIIE